VIVIDEDMGLPTTQERMKTFDTVIKGKLAEGNHIMDTPAKGLVLDNEIDVNDEPEGDQVPENDDYTEEAYHGYLNA